MNLRENRIEKEHMNPQTAVIFITADRDTPHYPVFKIQLHVLNVNRWTPKAPRCFSYFTYQGKNTTLIYCYFSCLLKSAI